MVKELPNLRGNNFVFSHNHLDAYYEFSDDVIINHGVLVRKLFVHTLEGDAKKWNDTLLLVFIFTWSLFETLFLERWDYLGCKFLVSDKLDHMVREFK